MRFFCTYIVFLLIQYSISAQIIIEIINDTEYSQIKSFEVSDSSKIEKECQSFLFSIYEEGYLYARLYPHDSLSTSKDVFVLAKGPKVILSSLGKGNAEEELLNKIKYKEKKISKLKNPNSEKIYFWQKRMLEYYEENGYPFSSVALKITDLREDSVEAEWDIDKGPQIVFDSLLMRGKYKAQAGFTSNWLGIKSGELYDEQKIKMINERIKMSEIASQTQPFDVFFSGSKAKIYLYLSKKKSSSFDGILGFAPDPDKPAKLIFNGDVFLKINNSFNHGEKIILRWKNSGEGTQEIKLKGSYPFIIGLPLGVNGQLEIFKKDSSYVKSVQRYGVSYYSGIRNESSIFYEIHENRIISQSIYENISTLPSFVDSRSTFTGLNFTSFKADQIVVPHKGYRLNIEVAFGKKEILKNEMADASIYENINLESSVFRFQNDISYFLNIYKAWHLMFRNYSGIIESNSLFENDLFLIGGLQNLRGFDEKSIAASQFSVGTGEIRYFLENQSYINLFTDFAFAKIFRAETYVNTSYFSIGTGISFSTRAGIFSIFYALGKEKSQSFNIKNGKVHFGIITQF